MRFLLLLTTGLLGAPLMAETAKPVPAVDPAPDANGWTLRLHRLPLSTLVVPGEENQSAFPALPSAGAGRSEIEQFLRRSTERVKHRLELGKADTMPEGFLAAFDPVSQSLAVRAPNEVQARIAYAAHVLAKRFPVNLVFNVHVVEGESSLMRGVMKEASRGGNHRDLWARVRGLVDQGTVREAAILHLDTRSGQRGATSTGTPRLCPTGFSLSPNGWMETTHEERKVGTALEIDPVLGPDGVTIDLTYSLKHDFAPPVERWLRGVSFGSQRVDSQLVDFRGADFGSGTSLMDGGEGAARLLGVWAPETASEPERANHLQAAFLTADIARVQPVADDRVLKLLETYGERFLPTPHAGSPPAPAPVPKGMEVRHFPVPMDFLESAAPGNDVPDPFAAQPAVQLLMLPKGPASAVEILKGWGISFPEGAAAVFSPLTSELTVTNLPENLDMVEAFVTPLICGRPGTLALTVHVVQADAKTLRDFEAQNHRVSDHTEAFRALEDAAAQGKAKFLSSVWLETRSGLRARAVAGTRYLTVSPPELTGPTIPAPDAAAANAPNPDPSKTQAAADNNAKAPSPPAASDQLAVSHEPNNVGFDLEVDPVIAPDGGTVDISLALSYHYAPPTPHEEKVSPDAKALQASVPTTDFHMAKVLTATTLRSGSIRLIGLWKPEGRPEFQKGDVLQAAFLRVDVVRVGGQPAK